MRRIILILIGLVAVIPSLLLFLLIQELRRGPVSSSRLMETKCEYSLEAESRHTVMLHVTRSGDSPGVVCVWVDNGTEKIVRYGSPRSNGRLERRWLKILWLPYFHVNRLLSLVIGETVNIPSFSVSPKGRRLIRAFPPSYDLPSPGIYRMLLRYRLGPEEELYTVYSEEFALP